jgi:hypothetical protein
MRAINRGMLRRIIIGALLICLLLSCMYSVDGFSYASNPCASFKSCRTCADAAGCGWCPDLKQCQPMAQDGFPIRSKDNSTGDLDTSPYLTEALPVLQDCPLNCELTELGDCNCIAPSVLNSCDPDCYAVYDAVGTGPYGSELAGSNTGSRLNCVCPYASANPKPGPYERKAFIDRVRRAGLTETPNVVKAAGDEAALELNARKDMIKRLQATTRVHVCSPHTYIIDSGKC